MIVKQNNEIYSDADKFVHIKNTDSYFKKAVAIGITAEQCEEVDEIPTATNTTAYEDKVNDLIRQRYSLSEELSVLRQRDTKAEEYKAYYDYCEQCKEDAKTWIAEHPNGEA